MRHIDFKTALSMAAFLGISGVAMGLIFIFPGMPFLLKALLFIAAIPFLLLLQNLLIACILLSVCGGIFYLAVMYL